MNERHEFTLRVREVIAATLRLGAILMILIGAFNFSYIVLGRLGWWVWHGLGSGTPFLEMLLNGIFPYGLHWLLVTLCGVGVAWKSRRISRWLMRMPGIGCSNCGYAELDSLGKCPECGQ